MAPAGRRGSLLPLAGNGATLPPLRAKMLHDMPWPRPQAPTGLLARPGPAWRSAPRAPRPLTSGQIRTYLHRLVERRRAWRSCHQAAAGPGSSLRRPWAGLSSTSLSHHAQGDRRSHGSCVARSTPACCTNAKHPRHRVLLMPPYAAGLRVSAVVRLTRTALARDRADPRRARPRAPGPFHAARPPPADRTAGLLATLPASPVAVWSALPRPLPIGTAQHISSHAKQTAGSTHGKGLPTRRMVAPPRLAAGGDVRTLQLLLGPQARDTTTRSLRILRQPLATLRSPCDLLPCGAPPSPTPSHAMPPQA